MCYEPSEVKVVNLTPWVWIFLAITIVMAAIAAGIADMQRLDAEQELYCRRVAEGRWPDFQHNYDICTLRKE